MGLYLLTFWISAIVYLKILNCFKITTFRRVDLPSSSSKYSETVNLDLRDPTGYMAVFEDDDEGRLIPQKVLILTGDRSPK